MSTQWTSLAPGRGDMASLASFSAVLASDKTLLTDVENDLDRLHKSLDLAVGGKTLDAASTRMARTLAYIGRLATSIQSADEAIEEYQETIAEIKLKVAIAEEQLATASGELSKTYTDSSTSPPSDSELKKRAKAFAEAQSDYDEATSTLSKMAQLRQAADDTLIAAIGDEAYDLVDLELIVTFPTERDDLIHTENYKYLYPHEVASSKDFSPEEAMKVFQENPGDIFPFEIEGATSFVDGDTIRLLDTTKTSVNDDGWVRVSTTPTSVTFTVISNDYFDGQGSTITFQTVERSGNIYLEQIADAHDVNVFAKLGVLSGGAKETWEEQAEKFRKVLENI